MTRDEILSKLTPIMRDIFDDETLVPTDSMTSEDVAEWDSTNHVRLMVAIEAEFGIRFETDEITAPENVGQLVDLIAAKLAG
ncbi:MAG TPA: acyl carrier protein [Rhizomicrobium sp.]|jgi:acyl carrier protein